MFHHHHLANEDHSVIIPCTAEVQMPTVFGISLCLSVYALKSKSQTTTPWILDTGATNHMISEISLFTNIIAQVSYSPILLSLI